MAPSKELVTVDVDRRRLGRLITTHLGNAGSTEMTSRAPARAFEGRKGVYADKARAAFRRNQKVSDYW